MSSPAVLEQAVSGRSRCRVTGEFIEEGEWRVGIEAFRAGRLTMTWLKPKSFLETVSIEYATNGRSKCKGEGTVIEMGEVRVVFVSGSSKSYYRPREAATLIGKVRKNVKELRDFPLDLLAGMQGLEDSHRALVVKVLEGSKAAAKKPNPARAVAPSISAAKRKIAVKTEKGADDHDDHEDEHTEDDSDVEEEAAREPLELVWAKHSTNPWWPGYKHTEPTAAHLTARPAGDDWTLVVFFGSRPSWAWVGADGVAPYLDRREQYSTRVKSAPFRQALKQADDEAAALEAATATAASVKSEWLPSPVVSAAEDDDLSEYEKVCTVRLASRSRRQATRARRSTAA
jgi:hypothetical protein